MEQVATLESQVVPGFGGSQNIHSSILKALDFTIDIDFDEELPNMQRDGNTLRSSSNQMGARRGSANH